MALSDLTVRLASWLRRSSAVRDLAWISVASVLVKPAWFVFVTAACMRVLGAVGYGVFASALAFAGVFVALTEFGSVEYTTREIARDPASARSLFTNLVAGRLVLGLAAIALGAGVAGWVGYSTTPVAAIAAGGLYALSLRVNEITRALYRATDAFAHDAVATLVERLATIAGGMVGLLGVRSPTAVLVGMAGGAGVATLTNLGWAAWRHHAVGLEALSARHLATAYRIAFPIGVFALCTILFHSAGPVLLAPLGSEAAAGHYVAAWRLVELFMLAPSLMTAVALPRLAARAHDARAFARVLGRSAGIVLAGTLALAVATALLAAPIVAALAGDADADFAETVTVLRMLIFAFPLMSLSMLFSAALIAADRQWAVAATIGVAAAVHIAACVWAIPTAGAYGVAVAMVGTYALATACEGWLLLAPPRRPLLTVSS